MNDNTSALPELLQHYPWLPSLKIIYKEIALKEPIEFINEIFNNEKYSHIIDRTTEIFKAAFENSEIFPQYKKDEYNISFYLLLKILLYILDDKRITNRIANLYSKIAYRDMKDEFNRNENFNLYQICIELGLNINYIDEELYHTNLIKDYKEEYKTKFRIHFIDYLKLASNLKDDYRKLVNNALSEGFVYIMPKDLARLIQEYVRNKFIEINTIDKENIEYMKNKLFEIDNFKNLYDEIFNLWELKKEDFEFSIQVQFEKGTNLSEIFPPCVREILVLIKEGQNISHTGRLFLTFFLHALNYPVDVIIEIFSTLPDFDKEKTKYQVDFAKKKGYVPHSCETLKSLNLCMASKYKDELCVNGYYSKKMDLEKKIKHPLFYIQFKKFRLLKNQND